MLDVAGETFASVGGFHRASMDEIAAAAGISKPMLYNYFGSKEGLYAAYIERAGSELVQIIVDAGDPEAAPEERRRRNPRVLDLRRRTPGRLAGVYREASTQGGPVAAEVVALRERIARLLAGPLASEAFAHAFVGAGESLATGGRAPRGAQAGDRAPAAEASPCRGALSGLERRLPAKGMCERP